MDDDKPNEHEEAALEERKTTREFFGRWAVGFSACLSGEERTTFRESLFWIAHAGNLDFLSRIVYGEPYGDTSAVIDDHAMHWLKQLLMPIGVEDESWFTVFLAKWNDANDRDPDAMPSRAMVNALLSGIRHAVQSGGSDAWIWKI